MQTRRESKRPYVPCPLFRRGSGRKDDCPPKRGRPRWVSQKRECRRIWEEGETSYTPHRFLFERLIKTYDVKSVEGKVNVAKEGVALLNRIPDKIRKDFYAKALAERLDVKEAFLYEMLRSSRKEPSKTGRI